MAVSWYNFGTNLMRAAAGAEVKHGGYIVPHGSTLKQAATLVAAPIVVGYNVLAAAASPLALSVRGGRSAAGLMRRFPKTSAVLGLSTALGIGYSVFGRGEKDNFTPAMDGGNQALAQTQGAQDQMQMQMMAMQQQAAMAQPPSYQTQEPMTASVAGQTQPINYLQPGDPSFKVFGAGNEVQGKLMAQQGANLAHG